MDGLQGVLILAVPVQVAVGGGDTGHVGAVLALAVVVVGHIQIAVDVVVAVGGLGIDVQILGGQGVVPLVGVELGQHGGNVSGVHQVQLDSLFLCHQTDGILKGGRVEGLVIGVQAGVDDGDQASCTGVALQPGLGRAGHLAGNGHVGLVFAAHGDHVGGVAVLNGHGGDALHGTDAFDGTTGHIGGDGVGGQGHVPDHIQLFTRQDLPLDAGGELQLVPLEVGAVDFGGLGADAAQAEAGQGGLFGQLDGDTDQLIGVELRFGDLHGLHGCGGGDDGVVHLGQLQTDVTGRTGGERISQHQHSGQHQGKHSVKKCVCFHDNPPFWNARKLYHLHAETVNGWAKIEKLVVFFEKRNILESKK